MSSRLPELERALFEAAQSLEASALSTPTSTKRWWRRHRSAPLLATAAALVVAGGAIAASGVLNTGAPVPRSSEMAAILDTKLPSSDVVLPLRVPDPDGGPEWGLGIYRISHDRLTCIRAARIQGNTLGVVGRDGVFNNDGRFHALPFTSLQSGMCGGSGQPPAGTVLNSSGPPVPASGYTGPQTPPVGGCLGQPLDRATTSKETRRKLRGVPICSKSSMRIVKYGFAGNQAIHVRYANDRVSQDIKPSTNGAYLLVLSAAVAGSEPLTLTVTYRDGRICSGIEGRPLARANCSR